MYTLVFIGIRYTGYVIDDDGYFHLYEVDELADIASLPTGKGMAFQLTKPRPGSKCLVESTGATYTLNRSREWIEVGSGE